jgi:hypothetical protein
MPENRHVDHTAWREMIKYDVTNDVRAVGRQGTPILVLRWIGESWGRERVCAFVRMCVCVCVCVNRLVIANATGADEGSGDFILKR